MAIAYVSTGTNGAGTTSSTPAYDAGSPAIAAGDLFILNVASKYPAAPVSTPNGWTPLGTATGGQGSSGADAGDVLLTFFYKVAVGTESGTETVSVPGGNSLLANIVRFLKTDDVTFGDGWELSLTSVAESTAGTAWSTAFSNLDLKWGDMLYFVSGANTNLYTSSLHALTANMGLSVTLRTDGGTAQGDNLRLVTVTGEPSTSDFGTGAITYGMTMSGTAGDAPAGVTALIRLRQGTPKLKARQRGGTILLRSRAKVKSPNVAEMIEEHRARRRGF